MTPAALLDALAGGLYASLPNALVDRLGHTHVLRALIGTLRLPLTMLRGTARRGDTEASVLVAGEGPDLDYMSARFFRAEPRREPLGSYLLSALPGELARRREGADLVLAKVDSLSARLLFHKGYLRCPLWLESQLEVPVDIERHMRRNGRLKSDLIRIRREQFDWCLQNDWRSFDDFYETMYCAYSRRRHGTLRVDWNKYQLRRCFRDGTLLYVTKHGAPVAAVLLREGREYRFVVLGTADGEDWPRKTGGMAALYMFSLQHGQEKGYPIIFFGGVRPCLSDRVLRYKEKWGISLSAKAGVVHDFLISWSRLTSPVAAFLHDNPLVFRDGADLSVVTTGLHHTACEDHNERSVWLPGLSRLVVIDEDSAGNCEGCKAMRRSRPAVSVSDSCLLQGVIAPGSII